MYTPYADATYYSAEFQGSEIPVEELEKALKNASRHIDSLTYNRIVAKGFDNLTEFQQGIIQEVCCHMAEFEYSNRDVIESVMQSYSINGVSMSFGNSWNIMIRSGIAVRKDIFKLLEQTGLCQGVVW
jgi:hypothetical protein